MVWCSIFWVNSSYFLQNESKAITVTIVLYTKILCKFIELELRQYNIEFEAFLFQQQVETAYTARTFRIILKEMLLPRIISSNENMQWPVRSSNVNVWNYSSGDT
ncbi:hypothetical protein ANN_15828 [Periplaneta americana]|uniref:Uncharacterized protein n=1 Tax=Periplaneta americana TaxID=6978 RepID=A0ABQ8SI06_PERAM|nr:hypothetical protein ANN_15828 [Periplaneta americana]